MKQGKKWIAGAIVAATVLAASAPAFAADDADIAAGVIFGVIAGAIIADAHSDHYDHADRYVRYRAPKHVEYRTTRHVYYDSSAYYPAHVYVRRSPAPRHAKLVARHELRDYRQWREHDRWRRN